MNMKSQRPFALIVAFAMLLSLASVTVAQDQPTTGKARHRMQADSAQSTGDTGSGQHPFPHGPGFSWMSAEMRFGHKTVTGAPFSAQIEIETTQTLADGTRSTHTGTGTLYRDSAGRTRQEMPPVTLGRFAPANDPQQMVFINDPVGGSHYILDATKHTAHKMTLPAGRAGQGQGMQAQSQKANHPMPTPPAGFERKTEDLGTQMIEGLLAKGTRTTMTIPAGKFGNTEPVNIVSEQWVSVELQTVVLSKHSDPHMGDHTYRLTKITRDEPASSLFEVPADYTVQEGGFGHGFRTGGGAGRGARQQPNQPTVN